MARNAALMMALAGASTPAAADPLRMHQYDGDTVAPTIRLTITDDISFDTPEKSRRFGALCDLEIERGKAASKRARDLREQATSVNLEPLRAADGSIARTRDRRRLLFTMELDGINIGTILAGEGHAMIYNWRTETVDWCATPPVKEPR